MGEERNQKMLKDLIEGTFSSLKSYYEERNYKKALEYVDKVLEIDPKAATFWNMRALTLLMMGRCEEALESIDKAIELESENLNHLELKNQIYNIIKLENMLHNRFNEPVVDEKEEENFLIWTNKILDKLPNCVPLLSFKAFHLYRLGRHKEAINNLNKALQINPQYKFAREILKLISREG